MSEKKKCAKNKKKKYVKPEVKKNNVPVAPTCIARVE